MNEELARLLAEGTIGQQRSDHKTLHPEDISSETMYHNPLGSLQQRPGISNSGSSGSEGGVLFDRKTMIPYAKGTRKELLEKKRRWAAVGRHMAVRSLRDFKTMAKGKYTNNGVDYETIDELILSPEAEQWERDLTIMERERELREQFRAQMHRSRKKEKQLYMVGKAPSIRSRRANEQPVRRKQSSDGHDSQEYVLSDDDNIPFAKGTKEDINKKITAYKEVLQKRMVANPFNMFKRLAVGNKYVPYDEAHTLTFDQLRLAPEAEKIAQEIKQLEVEDEQKYQQLIAVERPGNSSKDIEKKGYRLEERKRKFKCIKKGKNAPNMYGVEEELRKYYRADKTPYREELVNFVKRMSEYPDSFSHIYANRFNWNSVGFEYCQTASENIYPTLLHYIRFKDDENFTKFFSEMGKRKPNWVKKWLALPLFWFHTNKEYKRSHLMNKGYPLQYCFERKQWVKFDVIWNALEPTKRLKWGGMPIDLQARYLTAYGDGISYDHHLYQTHAAVSDIRAGSVARQLFYFLKKNGEDDESVEYYKNILTETRSFDFLQDIFDMIKPDIPEFVFACLDFHKRATGMKLNLASFGHGTDDICDKLVELNHEQFKRILELVEYNFKILLNILLGIDNDSEIKQKMGTFFKLNFNDLQFYKYVMQMHKPYKDFKNFGHFGKGYLKYINMKAEMEEKRDADELSLNVIDQLKLAEEIKSIKPDTPLRKTYEKKEYEFKSVLKFMEYHVQRVKRWADIQFEHKTSISEPELKQMVEMNKDKIPFCFYDLDVVEANISQSKHPKNEYLIVRCGEKIVAFQVFELKNKEEDTYKHIYIAWEAAKEGGYASPLKVLTMSHALDTQRKLLTLDLCGGHWFAHPSARMMNLDMDFKYFYPAGYREQAELLCKSEHHDCPIDNLKSIYFEGRDQKETEDICERYKNKRETFKNAFFVDKPRIHYPMDLEVAAERLVKMFVYVQEKHAKYLKNRLLKDLRKKKDNGKITGDQYISKMGGHAAKLRDLKRATGKLSGRTKNDKQLEREDNKELEEVKRRKREAREETAGIYKKHERKKLTYRDKNGELKWYTIEIEKLFISEKGRASYQCININDGTVEIFSESDLIQKQKEYLEWMKYKEKNPAASYNDYYEGLNSGSSSTTGKRKRDSRSRSPPPRRRPPPVRDDESKNDDVQAEEAGRTYENYAVKKTLKGHSSWVNALAVTENTIISGSQDKTIKLWNHNGDCLNTLDGHYAWVYALAVYTDFIISGSFKEIKIWTIKGAFIMTLVGHSDWVNALAVHKDKNLIISGSKDSTVRLWTLEGKCIRTLKGHSGGVNALAVHKDTIISGFGDEYGDYGGIKIWTIKGRIIRYFKAHSTSVTALAVHKDLIISASGNGEIKWWTLEGKCIRTKGHDYNVTALAVLKDLIISASLSEIKLWTLNGECIKTLEGHSDWLNALAVHNDTIISGGNGGTIKLWSK
eukprot:g3592.t1